MPASGRRIRTGLRTDGRDAPDRAARSRHPRTGSPDAAALAALRRGRRWGGGPPRPRPPRPRPGPPPRTAQPSRPLITGPWAPRPRRANVTIDPPGGQRVHSHGTNRRMARQEWTREPRTARTHLAEHRTSADA